MKKISIAICLLLISAFALQSCEDMDDNAVPVNDFIWKGLNLYYLWQPEIPNLADDRFGNQGELNAFLQSYSSPEALFNSLLYTDPANPAKSDRFSVLVSDYNVLEATLQGVAKSNGVEFGLVYTDASQTSIFGYVRYILPDSDASTKDIQRGDIFYAVNGTPLTPSNYRSLLAADTYTLNLADYNDGTITPNGEEVSLTKFQYGENPVYFADVVYNEGGKTIGYLMYNGFFSSYDNELNTAFGNLAAQGVNELVLDLRYNGGGSVRTATYLASMITGQFEGQLLAKEQWNPKLQDYFENNNPNALVNNFAGALNDGTGINQLNLNKVYILTTGSTASASELIINCLKPYIDVVQIGTTTIGKNAGSVTLYDSADFSKNDVDPSHRYAMQPLVLKIVNKNNFGDYEEGISPDIEMPEDYDNLGEIGNPSEPLLATAISQITAGGRMMPQQPAREHKIFKTSKTMQPFGDEMYIEEVPQNLGHLIKELP